MPDRVGAQPEVEQAGDHRDQDDHHQDRQQPIAGRLELLDGDCRLLLASERGRVLLGLRFTRLVAGRGWRLPTTFGVRRRTPGLVGLATPGLVGLPPRRIRLAPAGCASGTRLLGWAPGAWLLRLIRNAHGVNKRNRAEFWAEVIHRCELFWRILARTQIIWA